MAASSSSRSEERKPKSATTFLTSDAFKLPAELKGTEEEHKAFLTSLYEDRPASYVFSDDYKTQITQLCKRLHTISTEHKIIPENLAEINAFPAHLFSLIEINPKTVPSKNIKESLENILFLLQKKKIPNKDEIRNRSTTREKKTRSKINRSIRNCG